MDRPLCVRRPYKSAERPAAGKHRDADPGVFLITAGRNHPSPIHISENGLRGGTQAFRGLSLLLEKAIKSLLQKTRFYRIQSYCLAPCRFLGRLRHIVLSILAAIFSPLLYCP